jgi:beta-glucosidase
MMGNWTGDGKPEDVVTVLEGIRAAAGQGTEVVHVPGASLDVAQLATDRAEILAADRTRIAEAVATARTADAVVLVIGESGAMSGEASSRTSLGLPGAQVELAQALVETGKPVAVVLMNGRPLNLTRLAASAPAILEAWYPGTEAGHAVADVLFGRVNPGGKLPVTFPRTVGQAPIYYNHKSTGRPPDPKDKYTSKYLDVHWTPLYPFGHGLSYTQFTIRDLRLKAARIAPTDSLSVAVEVANAGKRRGDEVVQLYVQDVVASVTRPVQELKGFRRITLDPGERRRVEFVLGPEELGFLNQSLKWVVEPGEFRIRVSNSSEGGLVGTFEVR